MASNSSKHGFSLVELMVVVAIIGIIATVAVPNFLKFQAKAKQANAKSELSSIYAMEKVFYGEYNTYSGVTFNLGFVPDGIPLDSNNCPIEETDSWPLRYYYSGFYSVRTSIDVTLPEFNKCDPSRNGASQAGQTGQCFFATTKLFLLGSAAFAALGTPDCIMLETLVGGYQPITDTSFRAISAGLIAGSSLNYDVWTINQNKELKNVISGL